jgi:hypothetical protein
MVFWLGFKSENAALWLWSSIGMVTLGSLWYTFGQYKNTLPGIKNNHNWFSSTDIKKKFCLDIGHIPDRILCVACIGIHIYWVKEMKN